MTSEQEARKLLFKYNEDLILDEVRDYIKSTYGEHYAGGGKNIQIQDAVSYTHLTLPTNA